jgi:hypothetical protein
VPREPTKQMIDAAYWAVLDEVWRACGKG